MTGIVAELLTLLDLERLETDLFRGFSPEQSWPRVFGGQVVGQALVAAARTVPSTRPPHSLHAYFLLGGDPKAPIDYAVERIRDGRSFTTRRVVAHQHGRGAHAGLPRERGLDLAELDPEWTESFMRTTMSTYRGGVLTPQVVELLCIAVDAACTHLYAPGVRRHMRAALDLGVEPREILEVLKLATTVGVHSINVGAPILMEELQERERASGDRGGARDGA